MSNEDYYRQVEALKVQGPLKVSSTHLLEDFPGSRRGSLVELSRPFRVGRRDPAAGAGRIRSSALLVYPASFGGYLDSMNEVTRILSAIEAGDQHAAADLLPLVYEELRKLAAVQMAREKPGQTLDATALVHEAYLRLVGDQHFDNRRHFFAAAAEAMRRILVENARRRMRQKRGGERARVDLHAVEPAAPALDEDLLDLDEALSQLAKADPAAAELVKLRYFAGLSIPQAAEALGIGARSADRLWAYARAWLRDALSE